MSWRRRMRGAELAQVSVGLGLAAHGDHFVAAPGEHVDRDAAHAARSAGDDHGPLRGAWPLCSIWWMASAR